MGGREVERSSRRVMRCVCVCVCVCVVQCDQMQQQPTTPKKSGYKDFRIRKKKERKTDGKSEWKGERWTTKVVDVFSVDWDTKGTTN